MVAQDPERSGFAIDRSLIGRMAPELQDRSVGQKKDLGLHALATRSRWPDCTLGCLSPDVTQPLETVAPCALVTREPASEPEGEGLRAACERSLKDRKTGPQRTRDDRLMGAVLTGTRDQLLHRLATAIESVTVAHPVRVAVDGRPAAGKTTLADELALVLLGQGREVIRATIDSFLLPRAQRYRRGVDSPEGCYHDSFDFDALHEVLLGPLGPGGGRRFQEAVYDRGADITLSPPVSAAAADAVLVFDGVFLLRPELIKQWDLSIFVSATFEETLARARVRDLVALGSVARVEERFHNRYLPSQQLYFETVRPTGIADIVVHNDQPSRPAWEVRSH